MHKDNSTFVLFLLFHLVNDCNNDNSYTNDNDFSHVNVDFHNCLFYFHSLLFIYIIIIIITIKSIVKYNIYDMIFITSKILV